VTAGVSADDDEADEQAIENAKSAITEMANHFLFALRDN
jgi:hypothetical protein